MIREISYLDKKVKVNITNPNDWIQSFWLKNIFYEARGKDMLPYMYNNYRNCTIIDAGANIGNHSLFFSCIMNANVFAFEPHPVAFNDLQKNISLNDSNIRLFNMALGNTNKLVGMELPDENNLGMAKIIEKGNNVRMFTLDSFINDFKNLNVIKVDIEGYNIPFLEGATQVIQKFKPDLFIECENKNLFDLTLEKLLNLGYEYTGLKFNSTPTYLFKFKK